MKNVQLSRGLEAIVDDEDFVEVSKFNWHAKESKGDFYAARTIWVGGNQGRGKSHKILMHKVLCPCPDRLVVDHINGNTLDNRKVNLRVATKYQNWYNKKRPHNNLTGYVGVILRGKRWYAQIVHNKKHHSLGGYDTAEAAAAVYQAKAKELRAEFAREAIAA